MVKLLQNNPDFVTEKELEKYIADYDQYINKFFLMNSDMDKFLQFLKKHRDLIEEKIKSIPKFEFEIYEIKNCIDRHFFMLSDSYPFTGGLNDYESYKDKSITLRGNVEIMKFTEEVLANLLKTEIEFSITQPENPTVQSLGHEIAKSIGVFQNWIPGLIFRKYLNYSPIGISKGDKIIFNNNIHTPLPSIYEDLGHTNHCFSEIEFYISNHKNINSKITSNSNNINESDLDPAYLSTSSWLKKFGPRWVILIIIFYILFKYFLS